MNRFLNTWGGRFVAGAAILYALALLCGFVAILGTNCKAAETAIIAGVNQACAVATAQPDPAWVYFVCEVLDAAGNIIATNTVKVPAEQAQAFRTKYPALASVPDAGASK
jgi:hypothetical protein